MIYPRATPTYSGSKIAQRHLWFDDMSDFSNLPKSDAAAFGSDATCRSTGKVYIFAGNTEEWEEFLI